MKPMLQCPRTGATYPVEILDEWGRNGVGDGYGPIPSAFHLVLDPQTGAMVAAGRLGGFTTPLIVVSVANDAEDQLDELVYSRAFTVNGRQVRAQKEV